MRTLALISCAVVTVASALVGLAGAVEPNVGVLSVVQGKGVVTIEIRGNVLGRLASGTLRVTDNTPGDRYAAYVVGRRLTQTRVAPRSVLYKGVGLRFRMLGGGYRVVIRGTGIDVEAVGRGIVTLDGEPRVAGEDVGLYSLEGADCELEPLLCSPLPAEPERFLLGVGEARSPRALGP